MIDGFRNSDMLYTKYYKNKSVALKKHLYFIAELVHVTARNSWNTTSYPDRGRGNSKKRSRRKYLLCPHGGKIKVWDWRPGHTSFHKLIASWGRGGVLLLHQQRQSVHFEAYILKISNWQIINYWPRCTRTCLTQCTMFSLYSYKYTCHIYVEPM